MYHLSAQLLPWFHITNFPPFSVTCHMSETFLNRSLFQTLQPYQDTFKDKGKLIPSSCPPIPVNKYATLHYPWSTAPQQWGISEASCLLFPLVKVTPNPVPLRPMYVWFWLSIWNKLFKFRACTMRIFWTLAIPLYPLTNYLPQRPYLFLLFCWYIWVSYHGIGS